MKSEIIKFLQEKYDKSNQGVYIVDLSNGLDLPIAELKKILNELHKEKKIVVRQGINGKLIYLKEYKYGK